MIDDDDLASEYYRLRSRVIFLEQSLAARRLDPALAEMAELSRAVVHDLGNGLNVLRARMFPAPGRRGVVSQRTRRAMETAGRLCECLGLRIYALPELSADIPLRPSPVNLPEWLPELLENFRVWLGGDAARTHVEFCPGVERLVVAEYDRKLRLAVWELLLNAASSGTHIRVCVERAPDGQAQISVQDNGAGFPGGPEQAQAEALFRPGRAGIGLHVCRKIVEKHRGRLTLEDVASGGAVAHIRLPAGNPEPDWENEGQLSLAMEALSDRARLLDAELAALKAAQQATQQAARPAAENQFGGGAGGDLMTRFGALSASTAAYLARGLAMIRSEMQPLQRLGDRNAAALAGFALNKVLYLEAVVANLRILDPAGAPQPRPVDLTRLAAQARRMLDWRSRSGCVQVELLPAGKAMPVTADPDWLAAALLNVLRNAIDAAAAAHPPGSTTPGRVLIGVERVSGAFCARICDNGCGIPPQLHPRLFDFDYTSRSNRRYGLGLYVTRRVLESAGGTVELEIAPPFSTMITLKLPAVIDAVSAASGKKPPGG